MVNKTIQVNLRLPEELVSDLEFVCRLKKVQKNEWLKLHLAEILSKERETLTDHITRRYLKGYIDEKSYSEKLGFQPSKELKEARRIDVITPKHSTNRSASKKYLKEALKK